MVCASRRVSTHLPRRSFERCCDKADWLRPTRIESSPTECSLLVSNCRIERRFGFAAADMNAAASTQWRCSLSVSIIVSPFREPYPAFELLLLWRGRIAATLQGGNVAEILRRTEGLGSGVWPLLRPSYRPAKPADFRTLMSVEWGSSAACRSTLAVRRPCRRRYLRDPATGRTHHRLRI